MTGSFVLGCSRPLFEGEGWFCGDGVSGHQ